MQEQNKDDFIQSELVKFDEKFKCIQNDCDGNGYIPRMVDTSDGEAWEADQCQFHAEYLFPIREMFKSSLTRAKIDAVEEVEKKMKSLDEEYKNEPHYRDYGNHHENICHDDGYKAATEDTQVILTTYKLTLKDK